MLGRGAAQFVGTMKMSNHSAARRLRHHAIIQHHRRVAPVSEMFVSLPDPRDVRGVCHALPIVPVPAAGAALAARP